MFRGGEVRGRGRRAGICFGLDLFMRLVEWLDGWLVGWMDL